jgi:hypothetical protein
MSADPSPRKPSTSNNPAQSDDNNQQPTQTPSSQNATSINTATLSEAVPDRQSGIDAAGTSAAEQARKQQLAAQITAQKERTTYAAAHSVGIDGALNPLLANGVAAGGKFPKEGEPVMRKMENEPLGKRLAEEAREIGGVVRDAIGKVVQRRRSLSGTSGGGGGGGSDEKTEEGEGKK